MRINTLHPKYEEYQKKFLEIVAKTKEEDDKITYQGGRDDISVEIHRQCAKKIKELQKEYAYLWEPSEQE